MDGVFRDGHLRLASKDRYGQRPTSAEDEVEKGQQRREDRAPGPRAHDDPISKDAHRGHSRESTRVANGEDVRRCRFAGMTGLLRGNVLDLLIRVLDWLRTFITIYE
jgi:hypothetical protein